MNTSKVLPLHHQILHAVVGKPLAKLRTDHGAEIADEHDIKRSSHWSATAKSYMQAHPHCEACEASTIWSGIFAHQIHHRYAFHFCVLLGRPDLELDPRNLITFCEVPSTHHHLLVGHLGDFHSFNPDVEYMLRRYTGWSREKIEKDAYFQTASANRPRAWHDLGPSDRKKLRATLDEKFPADPVYVKLAETSR